MTDAPQSRNQSGPCEFQEDFDTLTDLVRRAGKIALDYFGQTLKVDKKPDGTQVSEADHAVDHFLKTELLHARPGYGWLSEESEDDPGRLSAARVWVVDPIDGTRAFLQHKPQWVVSAALVSHGRPVLGVVFAPALGEFFTACENQAARLNGEVLSVSDCKALAGSRIVASKSLFNSRIWREPWPEVEAFWANSIAYRVGLVAAGQADATLSMSGKSDWDMAAAHVIIQQAGGHLTAHDGSEYIYNQPVPRQKSVLASGPGLFPKLLAKTKPVDQSLLRR